MWASASLSRISAATSAPSSLRSRATQPVAEADEVVADVDRGADAVDAVQRFLPVAEGVVVLDVVVNEAGLVEASRWRWPPRFTESGKFPAGLGERAPVRP